MKTKLMQHLDNRHRYCCTDDCEDSIIRNVKLWLNNTSFNTKMEIIIFMPTMLLINNFNVVVEDILGGKITKERTRKKLRGLVHEALLLTAAALSKLLKTNKNIITRRIKKNR